MQTNEYVDIYTTVQGDTWDMIAYKTYGNENLLNVIMEANPEFVSMAIFPAGIELIIPDVDIKESNVLPPWKRDE